MGIFIGEIGELDEEGKFGNFLIGILGFFLCGKVVIGIFRERYFIGNRYESDF